MRDSTQVSSSPEQIRRIFDRVAGRYDLINSLISLGQHRRWKEVVAEVARVPPGTLVLDVCAGTGDIAIALARRRARVVALDFSSEMIAIGRRRRGRLPVGYVQGDALFLPFPDKTFEAATIGFSLRNVASRGQLFAEMARVVRPGGRVISLETSQPPNLLIRAVCRAHVAVAIFLTPLLSVGSAYRYLAGTIASFPSAEDIADELRAAGLQEVRFQRLMFGAVAVHTGRVTGRG